MDQSQDNRTLRICVVGAGIAGLTAAYRLGQLASRAARPVRITLLEASDRSGGIIETLRADEFVMERGPDSIITEKPWAVALCREIGLESNIIPTRSDHAGSLIVRRGALHEIPEGLHLMAPAKLWPFAFSKLVSWRGKLRMGADLVIPAKRSGGDESLAAFVRRRLGTEALERIAQPLVGGIYTADPERLSLAATMPRFIEMEQKYGSVIRGLAVASNSRDNAAVKRARGARYDLFVSLDKGLELLPETLTERIGRKSIRFGFRVKSISRLAAGGWRLRSANETLDADAVCVAAPAAAAASMLRESVPSASTELAAIESASSATLNLVYRRSDISHALDAYGFVVPAVEKLHLLACTFSSVKYVGRAPDDFVLLRAFVGGALSPEELAVDDATLTANAIADLTRLLGVRAKPIRTELTRWPQSMPQYHIGHLERVDRIEAALRGCNGLALAGNAYRGTGIPDCVRSGEEAANRLAEIFSSEPAAKAAEIRRA